MTLMCIHDALCSVAVFLVRVSSVNSGDSRGTVIVVPFVVTLVRSCYQGMFNIVMVQYLTNSSRIL